MAKIDRMMVGESLVGDGNEVAHIDLIIGPRGSAAESAVRQRADQQQGRLHLAARGGGAQPADQAGDRDVQQGHDQGRQAGGADVRPGAARRRDGGGRLRRGRHDPGRRSRQPVHLRRRVHPLAWPTTTRRSRTTTTRPCKRVDQARRRRLADRGRSRRQEGQCRASVRRAPLSQRRRQRPQTAAFLSDALRARCQRLPGSMPLASSCTHGGAVSGPAGLRLAARSRSICTPTACDIVELARLDDLDAHPVGAELVDQDLGDRLGKRLQQRKPVLDAAGGAAARARRRSRSCRRCGRCRRRACAHAGMHVDHQRLRAVQLGCRGCR